MLVCVVVAHAGDAGLSGRVGLCRRVGLCGRG